MYTRIDFIGLIDKKGNVHGVSLRPGLNLITGRSATGKSSIIEIFDYCMGESHKTIPAGIISDIAQVFILLLDIGLKKYVIGRRDSQFYIIDADEKEIKNKSDITFELFETHSLSEKVFKSQINSLFGLDIESTIEREEDRMQGGMKGAPSFRHTMSFILQHQNLIANKLALFYRFDEREKRDQTIAQFKIFAKYVDARYYSLSQEIDSLKKRIEKTTKKIESEQQNIDATIGQINALNDYYKTVTGIDAISFFSIESIKTKPDRIKSALEDIEIASIAISDDNKQFVERYDTLVKRQNKIQAKLRQSQLRRQETQSTINSLIEYKNRLMRYNTPKEATIDYSICPFCHQHTTIVEDEANRLYSAINKVNKEILSVPPLIKPQYEKLAEYESEIQMALGELREVHDELSKLHDIIESLQKNDSLRKQAYKIILRMEGLIEQIIDIQNKSSVMEHEELSQLLKEKEAEFKKDYDIKKKMSLAQNSINQHIADIRRYLPFEERFDGYALYFDIDQFELSFKNETERIPMRSVGSGSNWLNAHLCLFLALAAFFSDKPDSAVPSLLFLDQPSQVYFPSKDEIDRFDEEALRTKIEDDNQFSHDMKAVTSIFQALYDYCQLHKNAIQIIVTDHADNLKIKGLDSFNSIVAARWRGMSDGLIDTSLI